MRTSRRGSNVIEFALTFPILVTLMAGTLDYAWYFSQHQLISAAAREGARAGALADRDSDPEVVASAVALRTLEASGVNGSTARITPTLAGAAPNVFVTVEVSVPYPGLIRLVPTPGEMTSTVTARLEKQ